MPDRKIFIYAEGRDDISPFMADDVKRATLEYGWSYRQLFSFDPNDLLDDKKMRRVFPPNSAIIIRSLPKNTAIEIDMLTEWLNAHNILTINFNTTGGFVAPNDKLFQQLVFSLDERTKAFAIPTYEVQNVFEAKKLVEDGKIHYPFLLKPRDGSIGKGIIIIKDESELTPEVNFNNMAAQDFIESDYDWRVYTVGDKAVGALRRGGKEKKLYDFNAYANGIEKSKETDPEVLAVINQIAVDAAAAIGLEYCGCDIIRDKNTGKYRILEVNIAATWEGRYDEIIGVDIATEILKWCDMQLSARQK